MLFDIIGKFVIESTTIEINGKTIKYEPSKKIEITDAFFRNFNCQRCGNCCQKTQIDLFWTENDYYDLPNNIKDYARCISIKVDGREEHLWMYKNDNKECHFYKFNKQEEISSCEIHRWKPIICWLTPIWIDKIKDTVVIHKRIIKRNWKYGCKMKLCKVNLKEDIKKFERLNNITNYLQIKTYLPQIIAYLELCLKKNEYRATTII